MVSGTPAYGSITFCGFPSEAQYIKDVFRFVVDEMANTQVQFRRWAVLIDVFDQSHSRYALPDAWRVLDELRVPIFTRARLTKGGTEDPPWVDSIPAIPKQHSIQGGVYAHKTIVQRWLERVRGAISGDLYNELTKSCCHKPSEISLATQEQRKIICEELVKDDAYGTWRWCAEESSRELLRDAALHRWLAAKAFQTWPMQDPSAPVIAVVAICEGAKYLVAEKGLTYEVESGLYDIPAGVDGAPHELPINQLGVLGWIQLGDGTYGDFAAALRDWLVQPEQLDEGHSALSHIRIEADSAAERVYVHLTYAAELPEKIINPPSTARRGLVGIAWDTLVKYAIAKPSCVGEQVTVVFRLQA
jgi:hypothetical protein